MLTEGAVPSFRGAKMKRLKWNSCQWVITCSLLVFLGTTFLAGEESDETEPVRVINPVGNCTRLKCEKRDVNDVVLRYMSGHIIQNHTIVNR